MPRYGGKIRFVTIKRNADGNSRKERILSGYITL